MIRQPAPSTKTKRAEDVEVGRKRSQTFRPVSPVRTTGNKNRDLSREFGDCRSSLSLSRQHLQNGDLIPIMKLAQLKMHEGEQSRLQIVNYGI